MDTDDDPTVGGFLVDDDNDDGDFEQRDPQQEARETPTWQTDRHHR
jgi:hypothetical protein